MPLAVLVAVLGGLPLILTGLAVGVAVGWLVAVPRRRLAATAPEPAMTSTDSGRSSATPPPEASGWHADDPRIDRALGALPLGVLVTDAVGRVVYQNRFAIQFSRARHGDALVEAGIDEVVRGALAGEALERTIDLYGPPARHLQLRASPTYDEPGAEPAGAEPAGEADGQGGDGDITGSVVLIEDVTVAQQVDRVRKDFVANVSHELRTPVGAIGVLAETLRDAEDPEVVDRLAGRLHSEALRLGHVIEDLLALSKLESGQIEDPELVDLFQVAILAVERAEPGAEQREITIQVVAGTPRPLVIEGDQAQLVSAVNNLLDNAVKYSDIGAEVTVWVGREGEEGALSVTDTGVGIPEAAHQRIFERFYRVDDARSRATGGTGLGLSIVRHAVINHRGTISVTSLEGQGSSFTIRLPLAPRPDTNARPTNARPTNARPTNARPDTDEANQGAHLRCQNS
jgi:two-component system, OmpR family, sensor histidine kinase SenX3